jgi:UDP-glucose 4-epimerase
MRAAVAITGISGNLGQLLAKQLHREERIIGIDGRPFPGKPKDLKLYPYDLRTKRCESIFRNERIRALVHLGVIRDRGAKEKNSGANLVGTTNILGCCARYGVKKVVILSSATVYGASPENSNFLTEDAPLMGATQFPEGRDLIALDMFTQSFLYKYPKIQTVILRPVHIVGPTIQNVASSYLRLEQPWVVAGFDPVLQLIHAEDAARAIRQALQPGIRGIYNVVGPGEVPLSAVLRELGRKPFPLPHFVARPLLRSLFRYKAVDFPPFMLDFLQYVCAADGTRAARDWGWKPEHSMKETIRSVLSD